MKIADADKIAPQRRKVYLATVAGPGAARWPAALLLGDSLAAIGFAAGLSGAVVAIPAGAFAMLPWCVLALVSSIARGLFGMASLASGAAQARPAKAGLRRRIVEASLRMRPGAATTTGTTLSAIVDEVDAITGYVSLFLPARAAATLAPLLVIGAIALASPIAAAILVATLIPFIAAMALAGGAAAEESRRQFVALSRLSGLFADRIRALPIVLVFGAVGRETGFLVDAADDLARRTMRVLRVAFLSSGALEFFAALSVALVAVYAGFNLLGLLPFPVPEKLDLGRALFVLALAPDFYGPMRRLAAAYHERQAAETAAERLEAFEQDVPALSPAAPLLLAPPALCFRAVTIRYPGREEPILPPLSLDLPAGGSLALLGASGSGKSSLLHLLLGLAPLSGGMIFINDRRLSEIGDIAASVGWAGQSPLIVPGTIRDNLLLGNPSARAPEIASVVAATGLGPLLVSRRCGLDTPIDARGGGLSGGERRRIGLARALLRNAPLLLLDEPTAHLDAAAEQALIPALREAIRGRTAIIATHSADVAAIADRTLSLGTDR